MHYAEGELYIEERATNETFVCLYKWTFYKLEEKPTNATNHVRLHLFSISDSLILFLPRWSACEFGDSFTKLQLEMGPWFS